VRRNSEYRPRTFRNESPTSLIAAQPIAKFNTVGLGKWNSSCSRPRKQSYFTEQLALPKGEHAESPFAIGSKVGRESS